MMVDVRIPTAEGKTFVDFEAAKHYIAAKEGGVVVKATGLAKGKGVIVCDEPSDAIIAAEKMLNEHQFGDAGNEILVEEKLEGQEASILAFVDGRNIYIMESAQDHKPIGEGDSGANTGGMGAYTPAPIVDKKIMNMVEREVLVPIVDGMNRMGIPYKGILYAGIMLTAAGPKVLEFNCRFGDPECQPILSRMKGDIVEVMLAVIDGTLDQVTINWDKRPAICVVMSSGGYPGDYITGLPITGIAEANNVADTKVFHAGTKSIDGQVVTGGGRVLGITSLGQTIEEAQQRAYDAISKINFPDCYWRNDIADKAIKK
jgi:phosphoribosylamine--glycine ligase